jgi:cbb3-type cytochrome oxidase cytochrome c subunit/mono/diheme cytochrome c family protein
VPLTNRDKETLYPAGKLSRWFLVSSGLLAASLVWMLWADYDRPWRKHQADFYRRQAALLDIEKKVKEAENYGDWSEEATSARAEMREVEKKLVEARRALAAKPVAAEIAALEAELTEMKARIADADRRVKALKGPQAEKRFALEMAKQKVREGHGDASRVDELQSTVDRLDEEIRQASASMRAPDIRKSEIETRLADLRKDVTALEARRSELQHAVAETELQRAAAEAKTEKNIWRNMPVAEIVSPTIAVDKAVNPAVYDDYNFDTAPKVDVCMTCHRGIDRDLVSEKHLRDLLADHLRLLAGEKAWPEIEAAIRSDTTDKWWRRDAAGDWSMRPVTLRTWQGRWQEGRFRPWIESGAKSLADLFREDVTKPVEPAALAKLVDDLAKKDPLSPFRLKAVEWAHPHLALMVGSSSKHPMASTGCTVCHGGRGRSTEFSWAHHVPSTEEERHRWEKEYGWEEPEMWDWPMLPRRYVEGQCLKCHLPGTEYVPEPERLFARRSTAEAAPAAPKPVDATPSGVALARHADRVAAPERPFAETDPRKLADLVNTRDIDRKADAAERASRDAAWRPEKLERGIATMREWGCIGCHMVKSLAPAGPCPCPTATGSEDFGTPKLGTTVWADTGPRKPGPDLTHLADKATEAFVLKWILNPTSYRIDTRMPAFYRYRRHDDAYKVQLDEKGRPVDEWVMIEREARDEARMEVEVKALTTFLLGQSKALDGGYPKVPKGDAKKGAETFYTVGCFGCHVGPGGYGPYPEGSDDGARFRRGGRDELPPGPRLIGLGSKVKAEWLYEWLREPRHYWSATNMPNMRWQDEVGADGKTVVRNADQVRADVVEFLMASKATDFDAMPVPDTSGWKPLHLDVLNELWIEWYAKGQDPAVFAPGASTAAAAKAAQDLSSSPDGIAKQLFAVGKKLVGQRGCFGCHNVAGFEQYQPIGKDLSAEGSQDIHKFDFGILSHHEVPHTRWDWIEHKLDQPRVYDKGRVKTWADKLRMPRFNFTAEDREAVVTTVLGLVKEPIQPQGFYRPDDRMRRIAAGRAVVERYNCNQCHTIEGRRGVLTGEQADAGTELWMLPPNLYAEGERVHASWLFGFLKKPFEVRPSVIQRMPMFRLSDAEAAALVDYFLALADRPDRMWTDRMDRPLDETPYDKPVALTVKNPDRTFTFSNQVEEAKALFDTVGCVKCHLKKGTPGADPKEGASAPPFVLAHDRLRAGWTFELLHDPQVLIQGTKMVSFWPLKSRVKEGDHRSFRDDAKDFLLWTRGDPKATRDALADAQMEALVRYLRWHFRDPVAPTASPPGEPATPK